MSEYFSIYVDEEGISDDKLSLTSEGFAKVSEELENLVDVFFPDGEETILPVEEGLTDIRTDLMRYLDHRANRVLNKEKTNDKNN